MILSDVQDQYSTASAKASDVARQLAFAGVAVVWLFSGGKVNATSGLHISKDLLWPGGFLVLALTLDFFHAAYRAAAYGWYGRRLERRPDVDDTTEVDLPRGFHWPSLFFFWGKLLCVGLAYTFLATYFIGEIGG